MTDQNNPTLQTIPLSIDGKEFRMCFDFEALAEAEDELNRRGVACNVLKMLPELSISGTRAVLFAVLHRMQPEMTFADVSRLVRHDTVFSIRAAIWDGWTASMPPAKDDSTLSVAAEDITDPRSLSQ